MKPKNKNKNQKKDWTKGWRPSGARTQGEAICQLVQIGDL